MGDMSPTEKAKTAARQIVVAARETGRPITRDYIDVILTRDKDMPWADANVRTVRAWVRKLAILSTDQVALTDREERWMHLRHLCTLNRDELDQITDQLLEDENDPRGWDKNFVSALSTVRSHRLIPAATRRRLATR